MNSLQYYNRAIKSRARSALGYKDYTQRNVLTEMRRMKRQINLNKGERKRAHFVANSLVVTSGSVELVELTAIAQGDDDNQRMGRKVKIMNIDARFHVTDRNLDCYVIKTTGSTAPDYTDFDTSLGAHLDQQAMSEFTELAYIKERRSTTLSFYWKKYWRNGIPVYYNSTTTVSGMRNRMFLVFKNTTGSDITVQYSVITTFLDN
jgi:hypothetical protein